MNEEIELKDTIVGTFQKSKSFGFVVPDNRKLYGDVFISKSLKLSLFIITSPTFLIPSTSFNWFLLSTLTEIIIQNLSSKII